MKSTIVQTKVQTVVIEMRIQNQVSLAFTVLGNEVLQNSPLFIQDFLSLECSNEDHDGEMFFERSIIRK